ncbi:hypothetical protein OS493_025401 [Desmophyllum pertusum]|uniref:G-protein coupled receptors family 1 profile domain-containing protein n=1 Tax=Desmophyllum pertusum TaxID=174260 RepID=A0A9W9YL34_9CNID|nr:hypothetical protein OS493_025401 [Desmophyllum pertusum]
MENSTNHSQRAAGHGVLIEPSWAYAGVGVYSALVFLIVTGNLLVVIAFLTTTKLKTKTNYFIFSLAVADLLVGLFSVPLWIYFIVTLDFMNHLYQYYQLCDILSGVSSIMHLTCISVERCYAIVAPLRHRKISKAKIFAGIVFSWLLSIVNALLKKVTGWKDVAIFNTFAFFVVPLMLIVAAYIAIFFAAKKSLKEHSKRSLKKDLHIAYTVALVTGVFAVCWLPFFLTILIFKWCATCSFVWDMRVLMLVKLLHYGNSALNPIIYSVRNRRFNLAFKRILLRMICRKLGSGYSGMNYSSHKTQQTRVDTNIMTLTDKSGKSPPLSASPQSDELCTTKLV